jgi:hypothetical protein
MGPEPWWNTRLHLIASLAEEIGYTRGFVFVDADRHFLAMMSPRELKTRLAGRWPRLRVAYAAFQSGVADLDAVEDQLWAYPQAVQQAYGMDEQQAAQVVSTNDLQRSLGIMQDAEVVDVVGKSQAFLVREILGRTTPFVALVRNRLLEGLVDRAQLAVGIATVAVGQGI